jgi:hypothetical protein
MKNERQKKIKVGSLVGKGWPRINEFGVVIDILPVCHEAVIHWSTGNRKLESLSVLVVLA